MKLSDTPGAVDRPAPLVGEHTDEILAELGYPEAERQSLRAQFPYQRAPRTLGR